MKKKRLLEGALIIVLLFFAWRFVRPLNIFVVEEKFAHSIHTAVPEGLESLRASHCGQCHQEIYAEWSTSIHAHAWTDEYYQVDRAFEGNPPVCINCHIPLANQKEQVEVGFRDPDMLDPILVDNPDFDPELQREGVTCAVCHVRDGVVIGLHGSEIAPHPVRVEPEFLSGMSPCKICHVVSGDRWDMFYRIPPCGTVAEIRAGQREPDCVGCHLPRVSRPLVEGGPVREGGRHLFWGGHVPQQVASALETTHSHQRRNSRLDFSFTLTNVGTDHNFPTGTPDRHLTLELRLLDAGENLLDEEIFTMKRAIMWRPFIVDLWDTRLRPREPRHFPYEVDLDSDPQPAFLDVTVRYHLLDEARRLRISYENTSPVRYPIHHERIDLNTLP